MNTIVEEKCYTLLDQLEDIASEQFKANRKIELEMLKEGPKYNYYSEQLHVVFGMGSSLSTQVREFEEQQTKTVREQQELVSQLEKKHLQTIEDYAQRFSVVEQAIHWERPFTKYINQMLVAAKSKSESYRFAGKFNPKEFLSEFPELDNFKELFDTRWKIATSDYKKVNYDKQFVKGRMLKHLTLPIVGGIGAVALSIDLQDALPAILYGCLWGAGKIGNDMIENKSDDVFRLPWEVIEFPVSGLKYQAEKLESILQWYILHKQDFEQREKLQTKNSRIYSTT